MAIEYRRTKDFTAKELGRLFASVGWYSAKAPEKLSLALHNSTRGFRLGWGKACRAHTRP